MRTLLLCGALAVLALTAGCKAEPDFDQKFEQRSRELTQKAQRIEADANARLAAAREADKAAAELNAQEGRPAR
jgi:outer membrane murein-binding lipoprotein Lpp